MVHFPGFARIRLWIHRTVLRFYRSGLPHSDIPGSKPACGSPRLIAACHVLHRLLLPRHPPCALSSLTIKFTQHMPKPFSVTRYPFPVLNGKRKTGDGKPTPRLARKFQALLPTHRASLGRTPAGSKALIKTYSALYIYPIYSVVKHRPTALARSVRLGGPGKLRTAFSVSRCRLPVAQDRKRITRDANLVELTGIEPVTPCLQSRCSPS